MSEEHLLSIVSDNEGQVFIHTDLEGVRLLIKELQYIEKKLEENDCPHTHLFSESWGSMELTETKLQNQKDEKEQIHHLKIYGWNQEWKDKHNL